MTNEGTADTLQRAVGLHGSGHPARAAELYAEVLRNQPNHPDALHLLGVAETQLGRPRSGLVWIRKSLAVNPDQPAAIANEGNALLAVNEFAQALESYDQALRSWPDYLLAVYGRGNALSALRRWTEALASFDRVLELKPDFLEALIARGGMLQKLERPIEALATYDRAIELSPNCAEAFLERGHLLSERKQIAAARMSGSMLKAVGLPELIATSLPEYEQLALQLVRTPGRLAEVRAALAGNRSSAPLFDTDRFRRHVEAAYLEMVRRHRLGLPPATFGVAAEPTAMRPNP